MLKQLRKKQTAKKIFWLLVIVIIPPFIFWGTTAIRSREDVSGYAGKMFGKKITLSEYRDSLIAVTMQAKLQFGENFEKIEQYLGLNQRAWDRLILLTETNKRKIKTNDSDVIAEIQEIPIFQKDGKFNPEIYAYILRYLGIPARAFEESMRGSLKITKLYTDVTSGINIGEKALEEEYKKENEEVKADYLAMAPEEYKKEAILTEEEIRAYYDNKKEGFLKPVSVNIGYIGFDYPKEATREDKEALITRLENIREKIRSTSGFEKTAKEASLDINETGFFNAEQPIAHIGWSKEFSQAAFNLSGKDISPVLEIPKGAYILRLKEKKEAYIPEFDEVKTTIVETLTQDKSRAITKQKAEEILIKLKQIYAQNPKTSFPQAARQMGLAPKETPLFKRDAYIEGIGMVKEFSDAAFNGKENEPQGIIAADKAFYILKRSELVGIDQGKFAEVKEDFRNKLLASRKEAAFSELLEGLKNKAKLTIYLTGN